MGFHESDAKGRAWSDAAQATQAGSAQQESKVKEKEMKASKQQLPLHILDQFRLQGRRATLFHYYGDKVSICPFWTGELSRSNLRIYSKYIDKDAKKGLRTLRRLAKAGLLVEDEPAPGSIRWFRLADKDLETKILNEGHDYWYSMGYRIDEVNPRIHGEVTL